MDNVKTVYPLQTKFAGGIKVCRGYKYVCLLFDKNFKQGRYEGGSICNENQIITQSMNAL